MTTEIVRCAGTSALAGRERRGGATPCTAHDTRSRGRPILTWVGSLALAMATTLPPPAQSIIDTAAARAGAGDCPYDFLSEMPAGTFCVYRGDATGAYGTLCDGDAVVIWRTHAGTRTGAAAAPSRQVYFGFVDRPSLLVRAVANRRTQARIVDYRQAPHENPIDLNGVTTLDGVVAGPRTLTVTVPGALPGGSRCATAVYRGEFIGTVELAGGGPAASGAPR